MPDVVTMTSIGGAYPRCTVGGAFPHMISCEIICVPLGVVNARTGAEAASLGVTWDVDAIVVTLATAISIRFPLFLKGKHSC